MTKKKEHVFWLVHFDAEDANEAYRLFTTETLARKAVKDFAEKHPEDNWEKVNYSFWTDGSGEQFINNQTIVFLSKTCPLFH
jgi:hypothetical protein